MPGLWALCACIASRAHAIISSPDCVSGFIMTGNATDWLQIALFWETGWGLLRYRLKSMETMMGTGLPGGGLIVVQSA